MYCAALGSVLTVAGCDATAGTAGTLEVGATMAISCTGDGLAPAGACIPGLTPAERGIGVPNARARLRTSMSGVDCRVSADATVTAGEGSMRKTTIAQAARGTTLTIHTRRVSGVGYRNRNRMASQIRPMLPVWMAVLSQMLSLICRWVLRTPSASTRTT